jgi:hypothetical protein
VATKIVVTKGVVERRIKTTGVETTRNSNNVILPNVSRKKNVIIKASFY